MRLLPQCTLATLILASVGIASSSAQAATLIGSFENGDGGVYDLTAAGNLDWAYWNTTNNPFSGTTNSKLGGSVIADPAAAGGGALRGSSSETAMNVTYTDGTTVSAGTSNEISGLFNTQLATPGAGLSIDITLPQAGETYYITVWGSEYGTEEVSSPGIFTASLAGATDYTYSAFSGDIYTPKPVGVYNIAATADNDNDVLNITYVLPPSAPGTGNAHVLFDAIAVSSIPEPSAYAAIFGAIVVLGVWRRRRS